MKRLLISALALAAALPALAGKLADFTDGKGRAGTWSPPREVVAQPDAEVIDDAEVSSGKALKAVTSALQGERRFSRYDVVVKLEPGEAAKAKKIDFDVRIGDPKAFGWGGVFFFKEKRGKEHVARVLRRNDFTVGKWQHFSIPVNELVNTKNTGITADEAGQLVLSFFYYAPVEIRVANIEFIE